MSDRDAYSRTPTNTPCKSARIDGSSCQAEEHREFDGYCPSLTARATP